MPPAQATFGRGYSEDVLVPSAARTVSGDTGAIDGYGGAATLRVQLDATASSGAGPTLDVVIEDTLDGVNWNPLGTFAQKVAVGREVINLTAPFAERIRARWTIGGVGPSFTFGVRCVSQAAVS